MGKASRAKQAPKQPKIDHFTLGTEDYIALRRYMGSKPHDETRQLIEILERMPAVTEDDVELLVKQAERLAELEVLASDVEEAAIDEVRRMASAGELRIHENGEDKGEILDNPDIEEEFEVEISSDPDHPPGDLPVAKDHEEEQ